MTCQKKLGRPRRRAEVKTKAKAKTKVAESTATYDLREIIMSQKPQHTLCRSNIYTKPRNSDHLFSMRSQNLPSQFAIVCRLLGLAAFLASCSHISQRQTMGGKSPDPAVQVSSPTAGDTSDSKNSNFNRNQEAASISNTASPTVAPQAGNSSGKVGIILGPGGARAFAGLGVLQELVSRKLDIQMVVGIETGAIIGALFAKSGSIHEVEWQLFKIPEAYWQPSGQFLSAGPSESDIETLRPFLAEQFQGRRLDEGSPRFACPAFNFEKATFYMMDRGSFRDTLPFCLPAPGLVKPYRKSVGGIFDFRAIVKHMRSMGITKIIFVNTLKGSGDLTKAPDSLTEIFWQQSRYEMSQSIDGIDKVLGVDLGAMRITDFNLRRTAIEAGREVGKKVRGLE